VHTSWTSCQIQLAPSNARHHFNIAHLLASGASAPDWSPMLPPLLPWDKSVLVEVSRHSAQGWQDMPVVVILYSIHW